MAAPFWLPAPLKLGSLELALQSRQRPKAFCPYCAHSLIQSGHISLVSNQTVFVPLLSRTRPSVSIMEVTLVGMWSRQCCQDPNGKAFHLDGSLAERRTVQVWEKIQRKVAAFLHKIKLSSASPLKIYIYWHGLGTWLTWFLVMVILQIILEGCNQRLSDWLVR